MAVERRVLGRVGAYRLVRLLATGGMATVYEAYGVAPDGQLHRVAVKRMRPEYAANPRMIAMFLDEARIQSTLCHPNLVRVVDHGSAGGELFLAVEYVPGWCCADLLCTAAALGCTIELAPALYLVRELLHGLEYVHSAKSPGGIPRGLVHRDVAPSNVLVTPFGQVKLADFGIVQSQDSNPHYDRRVMGKVGYAAPEQYEGNQVGPRSDLFSVGVLLAELLMGHPLFPGRTEQEISQAVHQGDLSQLNIWGALIPCDIKALLMSAVSTRKATRPASAARFAAALERLAARHRLKLEAATLTAWTDQLSRVWREVSPGTPMSRGRAAQRAESRYHFRQPARSAVRDTESAVSTAGASLPTVPER